jgi:large subunit ribosomal protein L21
MQYRVEEGQVVEVARINAEPGSQIELGEVLLVGGAEQTLVGAPLVAGAKVLARVLGDVKGEKIVVFRYKNKKRYRRRTGHRQEYTRIAISRIVGSDEQAAEDQQPATASPARDSSITSEGESRQPAPGPGEVDEGVDEQE